MTTVEKEVNTVAKKVMNRAVEEDDFDYGMTVGQVAGNRLEHVDPTVKMKIIDEKGWDADNLHEFWEDHTLESAINTAAFAAMKHMVFDKLDPYFHPDNVPQEDHQTITNYDDIRDSLSLILAKRHPQSQEQILANLDDAVSNNSDQLVMEGNEA